MVMQIKTRIKKNDDWMLVIEHKEPGCTLKKVHKTKWALNSLKYLKNPDYRGCFEENKRREQYAEFRKIRNSQTQNRASSAVFWEHCLVGQIQPNPLEINIKEVAHEQPFISSELLDERVDHEGPTD